MIEAKIDLKNIKLIIWDLDETFWNGTISEEKPELINENINLIKCLVNKGVMNSICSKNDYENVKNYFLKTPKLKDIFEYFVFPSINWQPKGLRIKDIIEKMQLREENVLFIDDNTMNLNEAKHYCPNIKVILPAEIHTLIEQIDEITKDDTSHSRLKQYKILEEKQKEKEKVSSNEEFLYKSNIAVEIRHNCKENFDRILELINRTNQLNYTKIRLEKEELEALLDNPNYENGYIKVKDNWGEYGIIGFYSLNKQDNSLLHFLFSCRTLSMGVEQYVYSKLNFPKLEIAGDVANIVKTGETSPWINNEQNSKSVTNGAIDCKVLLKGPCDLKSVLPYLNFGEGNLLLETNENAYVVEALSLRNMVLSHKMKDKIGLILKEAPFLKDFVFETTMFDKKYNVIVISLLTEYYSRLYYNKKFDETIALREHKTFLDEENFEYYQKQRPLGFNWTKDKIQEFINLKENAEFINLTEIVGNSSNYTNNTDHFVREVYYKLSLAITSKINAFLGGNVVKTVDKKEILSKIFAEKIRLTFKPLSNITSFIFSVGNENTVSGERLGKFVKIFGIKIMVKRYVKD